jgi:hypothetical protein
LPSAVDDTPLYKQGKIQSQANLRKWLPAEIGAKLEIADHVPISLFGFQSGVQQRRKRPARYAAVESGAAFKCPG